MKQMFLLALVVLPLACWASCPSGQTKDEAALVQLEQTWAKALEQRDGAAVGCILAAEFEDADPNGKVLARVRFTDILVYRDGRWVAVAAQESLLSDTK